MTPEQAIEQQLIVDLGTARLIIAKQAGAVTDLQNQLADEKTVGDALRKGAADAEILIADLRAKLGPHREAVDKPLRAVE